MGLFSFIKSLVSVSEEARRQHMLFAQQEMERQFMEKMKKAAQQSMDTLQKHVALHQQQMERRQRFMDHSF